MEAFIWILVIAAVVGAVFWNHRNGDAAMRGVEFAVPAPVEEVALAIWSAHCGSAKAKAKLKLYGVVVTQIGETSFEVKTKIDDIGTIVIEGSGNGTSSVRAFTEELYIGTHPLGHRGNGIMRLAAGLTHTIYKILGLAPNAARMKRFQNSLEGRLVKLRLTRFDGHIA